MSAALKLKIRSKDDKKGKHKKKKFMGAGLKIIDPDAIQPSGGYQDDSDDNAFANGEFHEADELPQIVDVIDERPTEIKLLEQFRETSKWKSVAEDEPLESFKTRKSRKSHGGEKRAGHDSDISPPRKKDRKKSRQSDISPPRRSKHDKGADSDISPPRRRSGRDRSPDLSPPRKRKGSDPSRGFTKRDKHRRRSSSADLSPPRKKSNKSSSKSKARGNDSDLSPPRVRDSSSKKSSRAVDDDLSPPRRNRRNDSDSDLSPPRGPKASDAGGRRATTLDGKKAGLQRASALVDELAAIRRAENKRFEEMDENISGRYAKTKVRDRATGKERDFAEENAKQREEERKKAARKEQYDKWSKGLKQVEEQQARVSSAIHEMAKPLARGKDDADLDEHLKNIDREGDPMLKYIAKKKSKASGSGPAKPRYQGPDPGPNRFNIWPGYRWDGVDRSNGYEKDWFEKINSRKALQEESYKWSVEDL